MTTHVENLEDQLAQAWSTHSMSEDIITALSLRIIAQELVDRLKYTVTKVHLTYNETPAWAVDLDRDDEGLLFDVDVYDLDESLTDRLHELTPFIWETSPSLLRAFTVDGLVTTDRTFGYLDEAHFTVEQMLAGPRENEEQQVLEQAAWQRASEASAERRAHPA